MFIGLKGIRFHKNIGIIVIQNAKFQLHLLATEENMQGDQSVSSILFILRNCQS